MLPGEACQFVTERSDPSSPHSALPLSETQIPALNSQAPEEHLENTKE